MIKGILYFTGMLVVLAFTLSPITADACVPGVPCVIPLTQSDPLMEEQGPANPGPNTTGENRAISNSEACDADFMNQIYARAFLQAEREVVMNSSMIRKPDSVLEYTCFDHALELSADSIVQFFTETRTSENISVPIRGGIGNPVVPAPDTILNVYMGEDFHDNTIEPLVLSALSSYIGANFEHDFLGGASTLNNTIASTLDDIRNICAHMTGVYFTAKCEDMDENLSFFTFEELTDLYPRALPRQCSGHRITPPLIALANNAAGQYVAFDRVETFVTSSLRRAADECAPPVPTGITVTITEVEADIAGNPTDPRVTEFEDMVCPTPGCFYNPEANQCQ